MIPQRLLISMVLIIGVIFVYIGMNSALPVSGNTFTGSFAQASTWCVVGGTVLLLSGITMFLINIKGKHT